MKIIYKTGNLLDADEYVIAHQVNMKRKFGSGIAKAIKDRYPQAFDDYLAWDNTKGLKLGDVIPSDCGDHIILNLVGQNNYGRNKNTQYTNYDALESCFKKINEFFSLDDISSYGHNTVGFPLIGCGLGNAKWSIVSELLETNSTNYHPVVYTIDGIIPKD